MFLSKFFITLTLAGAALSGNAGHTAGLNEGNLRFTVPINGLHRSLPLLFGSPCEADTTVTPEKVLQTGFNDSAREYIIKPGENIKEKIRKNLFVKVAVNKPACYLGEPILASYKLYSRLISRSKITRHPSLSGFSVYDMMSPIAPVKSVETIRGRSYQVHTLKKAQLIPLHTGDIAIDAVEIRNNVHFIKPASQQSTGGKQLEDLLNQIGDEEKAPSIDQTYDISSPPLIVSVMPLPVAGCPPGFDGAVGTFTIEAKITSLNIVVHDGVVLKVTIRGHGNIPLIDAPAVTWPVGIDTLDVRSTETINVKMIPLQGKKTFEYQFIPTRAGRYRIPPVSLSYFDPGSHSYKTVSSKPTIFQVGLADKKTGPQSSPAAPPIVNHRANAITPQRTAFVVSVLLLSALAFWYWRRNAQLAANNKAHLETIALQERAAAAKNAHEAENAYGTLDKARMSLTNKDFSGFYSELSRSIWMALANKTKLPPSTLNKETVMATLRHLGWSDEMTGRLGSILAECESNLYSPEHQSPDAALLLQKTELLIAELSA